MWLVAMAAAAQTVEVKRDIVYARYGERQLKLDLYLPAGGAGKAVPGVVVIRGGGWRVGDKNGFAAIARGLAERGLAAACIEYRVLPEVTLMDVVNDAKAAVRWMRAEGAQYGIAPGAIGAIGGSAGGHLVALLGTSYEAAELEGKGGNAGVSSRLQAVVPMAPVVDFGAMGRVSAMFEGKPEWAKQLAPVTYVGKGSAAMLLMHGEGDKTVPMRQSEIMLERCKAAGVRAELVRVPEAPHAFWNNAKWQGDTVKRAAEFLHSVLDDLAK